MSGDPAWVYVKDLFIKHSSGKFCARFVSERSMLRSHMQALVAGARRTTATTCVVDCAASVPHSNSDRVFVHVLSAGHGRRHADCSRSRDDLRDDHVTSRNTSYARNGVNQKSPY